jgi:hypothetical protein|tara:strand:+ start:1227 stop:1394 length:168 start_codon:yes stop_codon:yes gene_type:complete
MNEKKKTNEKKKCGMCECTDAPQWVKGFDGTYTCGACMQEMKDMVDYDIQGSWWD